MKVSGIFGILAIVFLVLHIFTAIPLWIAVACLCIGLIGTGMGY